MSEIEVIKLYRVGNELFNIKEEAERCQRQCVNFVQLC